MLKAPSKIILLTYYFCEDDANDAVFCSVTYITCPADPQKTLAIKLPFLILVIKNMKKYFTFEVQVDLSAVTVCSQNVNLAVKFP